MAKKKRGIKRKAVAAMKPKALQRIRESLKLTQAAMAAQLGVQPLTISLWESGHTPISKGRALAIQALVSRGSA